MILNVPDKSPGRLQRIGVRSEPAVLRVIAEPVRAPGTIQLDERRISVVTLRAEGALDPSGIACKVDTGRGLVEAGLHPATGGSGLDG